jgi:hypothetical protein
VPVTWLKLKYRVHKPTSNGFKRNSGSGDGKMGDGKKRHKLTDTQKRHLPPHPPMMMLINEKGKRSMVRMG